jgi:hypothetical protein
MMIHIQVGHGLDGVIATLPTSCHAKMTIGENRNYKGHCLKMSGYRCHEEPASLNYQPRSGLPEW